MRILLIGDVFGRAGRNAISTLLPPLIKEEGIDLVVANVENATGGRGIDAKRFSKLKAAGVQIGTSGNHIWHHRDVYGFLPNEPMLLRPANFPEPCAGKGMLVYEAKPGVKVAVLNLMGRVFMNPIDCPFRKADQLLGQLDDDIKIRLVDFHAEATSEKLGLCWYLDGRVSAVVGTHTHVQTADERILPKGTAIITDLGMTGPRDSIIGMKKEKVIERFLHGRPVSFEAAKKDCWMQGVIVDVDEQSGEATAIQRVSTPLEENR